MNCGPGHFTFEMEIIRPDGSSFKTWAKARYRASILSWWQRLLARWFPMVLTHATSIRNDMADRVTVALDAGTTNAEARILIQDSLSTTLAIIPMDTPPSFAAAAGGVMQGNGLPWEEDAAVATGTATQFDAVNRNNVPVLEGSIGTTAADDITLPAVGITVNDVVRITACSYTAPQ